MKQYTFTKEERLCSKRWIDHLFHNGSSFVVYPFRVVFAQSPQELPFPVQVIHSVSKRKFKKAVDRNRYKRRMREVYRLEKESLYALLTEHSLHLFLAIQYISQEDIAFAHMQMKMQQLIEKLKNELVKTNLGKGD